MTARPHTELTVTKPRAARLPAEPLRLDRLIRARGIHSMTGHTMEASRNTLLVPVDQARSIAEFTAMVADAARAAGPGGWALTVHDSSGMLGS